MCRTIFNLIKILCLNSIKAQQENMSIFFLYSLTTISTEKMAIFLCFLNRVRLFAIEANKNVGE